MQLPCVMCGQALLATKAVNEKARTAAYTLLVEIGQSLIRWHPELTQRGCLCVSSCYKMCSVTAFVIDSRIYLLKLFLLHARF